MEYCKYCGLLVERKIDNDGEITYYCSHCKSDNKLDEITQNIKERLEKTLIVATTENIVASFNRQQLQDTPVGQLIVYLKTARNAKNKYFRKLTKGVANEKDFNFWLHRCQLIENILMVKQGFYPTRLTDDKIRQIIEFDPYVESYNREIQK